MEWEGGWGEWRHRDAEDHQGPGPAPPQAAVAEGSAALPFGCLALSFQGFPRGVSGDRGAHRSVGYVLLGALVLIIPWLRMFGKSIDNPSADRGCSRRFSLDGGHPYESFPPGLNLSSIML